MLTGIDCIATTCNPAGVFVLARCAIRAKRHFASGTTIHGLTTTISAGQGVCVFVVAGVDVFVFVITGRASTTAITYGANSFVHSSPLIINYHVVHTRHMAHRAIDLLFSVPLVLIK